MVTNQYTWEEAIQILRETPEHLKLINDSYLSADLIDNCTRFYNSSEFLETLKIIKKYSSNAITLLDIPAGNGIASFAFAKEGYMVTAVEPDESNTLGRKAIEFIKKNQKMVSVDIVNAWGEQMPFQDNFFDVIYIRQGLHHAKDLRKFVSEAYRVLKPKGLFIAVREPVVDNYKDSLKSFLDSQPDHHLYQGENAFTLKDYVNAFVFAGFLIKKTWGPYDNIINLYPQSEAGLKLEMRKSKIYFLLKLFLPQNLIYRIFVLRLKSKREPGRLFSFLAIKNH